MHSLCHYASAYVQQSEYHAVMKPHLVVLNVLTVGPDLKGLILNNASD